MNTFPAKLDNLSKVLTVVVAFGLIIPLTTIAQLYGKNHDYKVMLIPVLVVAGILFALLYKPTSYLINPSVLKISQVGFSKSVSTSHIESIRPVTKEDLGFGLRTFGSGGFLGYLGKFWYKKVGHVTLYVTDRNKMLLVTLKSGRKLMISPDDTEGFLTAFKAAKGA